MTGVTPPRTRPLPTIASSLSLLLSRLGLASTVPAVLRYEDGLQTRQTVDALGVLARPVGGHPSLPLAPGRFNELSVNTAEEVLHLSSRYRDKLAQLLDAEPETVDRFAEAAASGRFTYTSLV
jgi:hypothetical protein